MSRFPEPPAYVPTLTDIVRPAASQGSVDEIAVAQTAVSEDLQTLMVQRVLQDAEGLLASRLHEATEQLIRAHVQALLPKLVDEIERVVRDSVNQAIQREMSQLPDHPDCR